MARLTTIDAILTGVSFFLGYFLAPSFGRVTDNLRDGLVPLRRIRAIALALAPPRPTRKRAARRSSPSDSDVVITYAVGALAAVGAYLRYRIPILVGISVLAVIITTATTISVLRMSRAGVVADDKTLKYVFVSLIGATFAGLLEVALLFRPPAGGNEFMAFLREYDVSGNFADLQRIIFVLYQIMGAVAYVAVGLGSIAFCAGIYTSINLYSGTTGKWLWRRVFRLTHSIWGRPVFIFGVVLVALSFILSGGWLYQWIAEINPGAPTLD